MNVNVEHQTSWKIRIVCLVLVIPDDILHRKLCLCTRLMDRRQNLWGGYQFVSEWKSFCRPMAEWQDQWQW